MSTPARDAEIKDILAKARVIALVGASDKPERDSNEVMKHLLDYGYTVIPVNPTIAGKSIHGQKVVASLEEIGRPIDIVDIFRRSELVPPIVDSAIAIKAKAVWMQLGIVNEEAAAKARAAGLKVVMNRCLKVETSRLNMRGA